MIDIVELTKRRWRLTSFRKGIKKIKSKKLRRIVREVMTEENFQTIQRTPEQLYLEMHNCSHPALPGLPGSCSTVFEYTKKSKVYLKFTFYIDEAIIHLNGKSERYPYEGYNSGFPYKFLADLNKELDKYRSASSKKAWKKEQEKKAKRSDK
jgi:hypothetical protein